MNEILHIFLHAKSSMPLIDGLERRADPATALFA